MKFRLASVQATEALGVQLFRQLPRPALVFLQGHLGAGKTTLVRGFLRAAGYRGSVKSPTYNLVEEYCIEGRYYYHFDLYRLTDPEELEWLGIRDYLTQAAISFVEWPEMGQGFLPEADVTIQLNSRDDGRVASLQSTMGDFNFIM